ncbi:hypothetical protein FOMA001_g8712 [Fusarium oxysporum f. sp. matthiolae]|nr:hypothetical protein FOMA001_g8712 [Fusarium oxysporum f. sp. matthiolae]
MNLLYELADEFRRSLKAHHEEEFENTTIGDMRKEIHDIQLLRDKTNNMMDMNRLRMFLGGMEELEKVLLRLQFPGTTGVMSIVWGSVRFLLRVIIDLWFMHGTQLKAYRRLQRPIWDDASHLFSRLSDFLGSHAKFIKERSPSTQDYDALHAAFQQYSYGLKSDWKNFEAEEKTRRLGRKYEVTEWITSSPKMSRLQDEFREMAICPKSGRWLFRNYSDISEWMGEEDPPHSAIWLHGNVGYGNFSLKTFKKMLMNPGKTVLASLIVNELKSSKLRNPMPSFPEASKTCYFYCQEDDVEHRNHLDVLKGILLQMVDAEDYIIPYCYQEKVTSGGSILIDAKLAQKLIKTFIEFSVRHYIVIDGADECHGAEIQQTAKFFKDLVSAYDTQIRLGHLRVLFIGRETSDTKKHIPGDDCISIALRPEDNHDDIRAFVQKKLPEFSKSSRGVGFSLSEADKADVERIICHQSQGLY